MTPSVLERPIETSCSRSGKHEGCNEKWRKVAVKRLRGLSGWEPPNHRHKSWCLNELKICLWEERKNGPIAPRVNLNNPQHHRNLDFEVWVRGGIAVTSDSRTDLTYTLIELRNRNERVSISKFLKLILGKLLNIQKKCQSMIKITTSKHLEARSSHFVLCFYILQ